LRHILIAVLLLAGADVAAQQYFFKNFSVESGLPFVQVSCMHQDSLGYLWSGGYGGLSRFDGQIFLNYNRRNGLADHNVNAISSDNAGKVFIGTSRGLSVLDGNTFTSHSDFGDSRKPHITSLCRGYHHSMYIGTTRGLYMYRDGHVKPVRRFEGMKVNHVFNPDTTVIFAGTDEGLVIFGHKTWRILDRSSGLRSAKINCIDRFRNFVVIGTSAGLSLLDVRDGSITNYHAAHGLIDENITALCNQRDRYLWIGSESGLFRFDGNTFTFYEISSDNNANKVRSILNDREDNLWLGTHSGLYRYRDNSFSTYNKAGLSTAFTFQIFRDRRNDLWVTTQNSGVYLIGDKGLRHFTEKEGLKGNTSRAAVEDNDGRLLFGTDHGVVMYSGGRFTDVMLPAQAKGAADILYVAKDGKVWIGSTTGVTSLWWADGKPQTKFYPIDSRNDYQVYGFCEDDEGNLYIGTFKAGLFRLRGDTLVNLTQRFQLNEENFFTLKFMNGKIFAASLNGVLVIDAHTYKLTRITDMDGLNSDLVYSLEFTRDGQSLWIGTNQGINRLDLTQYFRDGKAKLEAFGLQEGFAGVECNSNGIWEDPDGTFWFGTVSGLILHQPFHYKRNHTESNTVIQRIQLMNEDTILADSTWLPSDYNTISFYYRGICLTNPAKVLYQRRLEGLREDRDWSNPGPESYIKYTNLRPGAYTFRIRSCNNEGLWNRKETTFTFFIRSPFYLSWWFIVLAGITIFSSVYGIFLYRIYTIKRKQRQDFERKVEMSKIELKALRSQMNPHFIFNSLNAIQHYIFNTKSDEAIKYLNKFARLVRIILSNSEKQTVTVGEDLDALKLYLELEQMRFEGKFDYEVVVDQSVDPDYDIMPPLLMQPYVENAILHGLNPKPGKGKLNIRLHSENNFLICTITDNGIGREGAAEIRRTMPLKNHQSFGMKITEDRLRILNAINNSQLSVTITDLRDENGRPAGTQVELFVPLVG
jgi:ligand-binding sensor domain-containing protein